MNSRVDVSETFSADQLCFRILSGLFQRCSLPENLWNSADFWIIQNDNFWLIFGFHFFQNFSKYLNSEAHNSGFQPSLQKEVRDKSLLLPFRRGQRYLTYLNFWVYCYCSSNKTDMVQLFKNIFAFIGVKFRDYSKKFESLLSICRIFTFSLIQHTILMTTSCVFSTSDYVIIFW